MIMDRKMMNSAIAFILASMCFWNCQNEKPEEGGGSTTSDADLYIECPGKVNVRTDPDTGGSQVIKFIIRKSGLGAAEARIDVMTTSELRQKIGSDAASYTVIPDNAYNISVGKVEFSDTESEKSVTVTVDRSALAGQIDYAPGKFTCLPIAVTSQNASVTSDMDYVVFVFRPDDGYHFSTWNYEGISSSTDIDQAVKDWKEAGLTIPMTFDLKSTGDLSIMTGLLDKCEAAGMKVIINDTRKVWWDMDIQTTEGAQRYREKMQAMKNDFGSHPAVWGYFIADEPDATRWEEARTGVKIAEEVMPETNVMVNMHPFWEGSFVHGDITVEEYADKITDFVESTGIGHISVDSYSGIRNDPYAEENGTTQVRELFRNYWLVSEVCSRTGAEPFFSLLCAGEGEKPIPDRYDFRWQINTAVAHGMTGIQWYTFYSGGETQSESPFCAPVVTGTSPWYRTETFDAMAAECKAFTAAFADRLEDCSYRSTTTYGRSWYEKYGTFGSTSNLRLDSSDQDKSMLVTEWADNDGAKVYTIVNIWRDRNQNVSINYKGRQYDIDLLPAEMVFVDKKGVHRASY